MLMSWLMVKLVAVKPIQCLDLLVFYEKRHLANLELISHLIMDFFHAV